MPYSRRLLILLLLQLICNRSFSQKADIEYIKKNLVVKSYAVDTEASAVVLFEKHTAQITTENGTVQQLEKIHRIIRILKSDAMDVANVAIYYPADDYNHYIDHIDGTTYNMEGEEVIETPLPKKDRYKKSIGNNMYEVDFILPAVKEGSIIDYSYEIVSLPHDMFPVWYIQGQYPKLMTEYQVFYPPLLEFTIIAHTRFKAEEFRSPNAAENDPHPFCKTSAVSANTRVESSVFWVRKNVEAIKKDEPFVTNISKETERLELQFSGVSSRMGGIQFRNTWDKLNDYLWAGYKKQLYSSDDPANAVVDSLLKIDNTEAGRINAIYKYVRSNFALKNESNRSAKNLYEIFVRKSGDVTEINSLLVAMLIYSGVNAAPMLLATTHNIPLNPAFPIEDRANYLVCAVTTKDSAHIYLDASDKNNVFGMLPYYCYNGFAWILGNPGLGVTLTNDQIHDKSVFGGRIYDLNDSGAKLEIVEKIGLIQSEAFRKSYAGDEKKLQTFIDEGAHKLSSNISVLDSRLYNENKPDTNIIIKYTCSLKLEQTGDVYYINSMLLKFFKENPFKSTVRKLPVEFPYKTEARYYMSVQLPENIEPDSLAPPLQIIYEKNSMSYLRSYNYDPTLHVLTVDASYNVNSTTYPSEYYESIRDFFQKILPLGNEMITLKKNTKK